jgi:hypothetical protein
MLGHAAADQTLGDGQGFDNGSQEKNLLGLSSVSSSSSSESTRGLGGGLHSSEIIVDAVPIDVAVVLSASQSGNELEHGRGGALARSVPTVEGGKARYQDLPFLVAFLVHMAFVLGVGLFAGIPALNFHADPCNNANATASCHNGTASAASSGASAAVVAHSASLLTPVAIALLTAVPLSFAALYLIQAHAMAAVKCMMVVVVLLKVMLAIWCLATGLVFAGLMVLLAAALTVCFLYFAKNRLAFAAVHLELACEAVRGNKMTAYVAFASQVCQLLWMLVWVLGLYGITSDYAPSSNTGTFVATVTWVFFLYWFCYTAQNVAHCTTSGVVGSWWFTQQPTNAVSGSLKRALTTSFGSIAFGSLIVALIQTVRFVLRSLERSMRRNDNVVAAAVICCARCLIRQVEELVRYFNKYAFIVVSLYGKSFRAAGGDVWSLFHTRGWSAIINDDLVETVLYVACLGIAAVTALVGGGVALAQSGGTLASVYVPVLLSFFVGILLSATILGVIDSATKTIFVCYAKAPSALHATHPTAFFKINDAWSQFHPDTYETSGYKEIAVAYGQPVQSATSVPVFRDETTGVGKQAPPAASV